MIQRRQTLFLFQLVFLGIALLFVPIYSVISGTATFNVFLIPIRSPEISSTIGHLAAIVLNFLGLILASVTIFMYKRRELQVKLCYVLMALWTILTAMMTFCPFVVATGAPAAANNTFFGPIIGIVGIIAAYLACRFIKKDIELLKSADRIR